MQYVGSSPRCPCGQYYVATMPTGHFCSSGTWQVFYQIHLDQTAGACSREFDRALRVAYQPAPAPREREFRKRWLAEHARKYAGRRP